MMHTIFNVTIPDERNWRVVVARNELNEYILAAQTGLIIRQHGPISAAEMFPVILSFFRDPQEKGVVAEASPTFGNPSNLRVVEVGPGLYDVVVGLMDRVRRFVPAEEVMKTLGSYLQSGVHVPTK